MTAVPEPGRITAEEYLSIACSPEERTELRDGEIVAMAPPTWAHQRLCMHLGSSIEGYIRQQGGSCQVNLSAGAKLSDETLVIPDVMVVCDPSRLDEHGCNGAPDWVIEVLSTNRRDDLIDKLILYRKAGVREYWIVDPQNEKTLVYFFEKNDFPDIYTFDTPIPVGIYEGKLAVRIAELV
ncbi:MAG: Uma2 family endonuclease [Oscillospiraceae bacterium]|nr:Uma2 family endonuclease [Oscillospiraceae bacterium]